MKNYIIRKSKIEDMVGVMSAHKRSIEQLCIKDYSPEQIQAWANINYSPDIWKNSVNQELHYVVEVENTIEGFCHSAVGGDGEGEVKGLYFTPKIKGLGIGKELFELSMKYFIDNNCTQIKITGTKTAKGFYQKMGFSVINETTINIRGTTLECFKMGKKI